MSDDRRAIREDGERLLAEAKTRGRASVVATRLALLADLVFVGTWVDGLILFGHRPGDAAKVNQIPKLWDKRVAAFMTHAVNPGRAADMLAGMLASHGAEVVAARSLSRWRLADEAPTFAAEVLAAAG